jgi:AdoMet-dependent heme synthase
MDSRQAEDCCPSGRSIHGYWAPRSDFTERGIRGNSLYKPFIINGDGSLAAAVYVSSSHQGEVYACGYLPVLAGDLRQESLEEIWRSAAVFQKLRDTGNLKGKCGRCEFRNICMGCRARAYAATGNYLDEEPFCIYEPQMQEPRQREATCLQGADVTAHSTL